MADAMRRAALSAAVAVAICLHAGAQSVKPPDLDASGRPVKAPAEKLSVEQRVTELEQEVKTLRSLINILQQQTSDIDDSFEALDCDTGSFVFVRAPGSTVSFLAACRKLEP